jgi:hypothetical protein
MLHSKNRRFESHRALNELSESWVYLWLTLSKATCFFDRQFRITVDAAIGKGPWRKKIAVAVPRGQNDDGDHGSMTGVDGRTQ